MDTATVIANLDLIITVGNSIAHVAGALGKKVWMLLPYSLRNIFLKKSGTARRSVPSRKARTGEDWYPSMRLFRQPKPYDWHSTIEEVKNTLKNHINRLTIIKK